jgi:hypothetical protein
MIRAFIISIPAFIFILSGCVSTPRVIEEFTVKKEVIEFCNLLRANPNAPIKELLAPYGPPGKSTVEEVENRHDPNEKDKIYAFSYEDGELVIYSVPHIGRNYISKITLTDKFWPNRLPRQVGKSSRDMIQYFGKPNKITGGDYIYYCSPEVNEFMMINIVNDRVSNLRIEGWVD